MTVMRNVLFIHWDTIVQVKQMAEPTIIVVLTPRNESVTY